jgi:tRNA(His) 5'-end guanylyltransferase
MKGQYEVRAQTHLPRRTYTIIRLDGKAFHTYSRGCKKPYDKRFSGDMQIAAATLCEEAQGTCLAYVQSDEISVLLTDFASTQTDAWFDGNVQKIVSVATSVVTAAFNAQRPGKTALFDGRAFTIPDRTEVENYFIWRQQDCSRNSIAGLAQSHFSHKQLHGKSGDEMQEMMWQEKGVNWADSDPTFKNGAMIYRELYEKNGVMRSRWTSVAAPVFTQERDAISALIPKYG